VFLTGLRFLRRGRGRAVRSDLRSLRLYSDFEEKMHSKAAA
jgi:hypothetical protein